MIQNNRGIIKCANTCKIDIKVNINVVVIGVGEKRVHIRKWYITLHMTLCMGRSCAHDE